MASVTASTPLGRKADHPGGARRSWSAAGLVPIVADRTSTAVVVFLPLRTVAATLSSSLVILIVGGFFLVRQATAGIVEAKRTSAIAETTATINRIQGQLRDTDLRTASLYERLNLLADDAAS